MTTAAWVSGYNCYNCDADVHTGATYTQEKSQPVKTRSFKNIGSILLILNIRVGQSPKELIHNVLDRQCRQNTMPPKRNILYLMNYWGISYDSISCPGDINSDNVEVFISHFTPIIQKHK